METGDEKINSGETMETVNANTTGNDEGGAMTKDMKTKNSGMLIGLIVLAIVALGGIGFGVWAMVDGNNRVADVNEKMDDLKKQNDNLNEQSTKEETLATNCEDMMISVNEKYIDNDLAQNLISPYLGLFNYLSNIFDYEFSEDVKVEITYQNLSPNRISTRGDVEFVRYTDLNAKYQELFGGVLEKRDYRVGHSDSFTFVKDEYNELSDIFEISRYAGGGAAMGMISAMKNAQLEGDEIIVDMYHEVVGICGAADGDYCIPAPGQSYVGDSMSDTVVREFVEKYADRIPVYAMTFVKDDGRYVLSAVTKK